MLRAPRVAVSVVGPGGSVRVSLPLEAVLIHHVVAVSITVDVRDGSRADLENDDVGFSSSKVERERKGKQKGKVEATHFPQIL